MSDYKTSALHCQPLHSLSYQRWSSPFYFYFFLYFYLALKVEHSLFSAHSTILSFLTSFRVAHPFPTTVPFSSVGVSRSWSTCLTSSGTNPPMALPTILASRSLSILDPRSRAVMHHSGYVRPMTYPHLSVAGKILP